MIFAFNMPKMGSLWGHCGSRWGHLRSLGVTWGHLGSLDGIGCPIWCHFGVTCARLEGTWGHLGRPLGVTWGHLGPLVSLFGVTLGSLGLQIGPKIA